MSTDKGEGVQHPKTASMDGPLEGFGIGGRMKERVLRRESTRVKIARGE